ncbi:probable 28S rRNA (cytosine-C(5))-methyltransferase [Morus notabilis]|uniref:probable 28S rRNA (cytosine-C(5))-methyltransferase n=1 Tax=Morus notabilis TaxID=981085 RepID=UPI000CED4B9A|nr:probable 28S rRNA (cytosine-C(5))-methyltransferase [Morus notabilis]
MARTKSATTKRSTAAGKSEKQRRTNAERSAFFARREAAKVLRLVLQGDARRRAVGSIKSLVYRPSVRNKKATFALVCQTLKHLCIIKEVLNADGILNSKWKKQEELVYIIVYDILFGQAILSTGDAEKFLSGRRDALVSGLASLLKRRKVKNVQELIALYQSPDISKPRYVRVNTLKLDVESARLELEKQYSVQKDELVPDLLILPPGCDLHNHPLVVNGSIFLQGKASSMVAAALDPKPGWEVLDACSAPGNKTVHLSALMRGKGKIVACELNKERVKRLNDTVKLSGASNIKVLHGDFLGLNANDPSYSKVRAILLDPSCSGSGTASVRLDHLLPSYAAGQAGDGGDEERLNRLAAFQRKALEHALSFPAVERVVYSTCSIHQTENEDVVKSVLPLATSHGFRLEAPFPRWQRRGLPVFEGAENLLRTDPVEDKEGFFIALFVRENHSQNPKGHTKSIPSKRRDESINKKEFVVPPVSAKFFKLWLYALLNYRKTSLSRRGIYKTVQ